MAAFIVTITEVHEKKIRVSADSQEAAELHIQEEWNNGFIDNDYCIDFKIVGEPDVGQVI